MSRHFPDNTPKIIWGKSYPSTSLSLLNSQCYTALVLRDGFVIEVSLGCQSEFLHFPELAGRTTLFFQTTVPFSPLPSSLFLLLSTLPSSLLSFCSTSLLCLYRCVSRKAARCVSEGNQTFLPRPNTKGQSHSPNYSMFVYCSYVPVTGRINPWRA